MKKDVKDIIQKEEAHLNNLLTTDDLSTFKGMVDELRDTWNKKQMFRTETEARFSVLKIIDTQLKHQNIGNVLENNHHI